MLNYIKKIIAGIVVGIANVIPGVSGGTIAVVFGVYSDLIGAASFDIKVIKANLKVYFCLFGGMGMGILIFARLFKVLYQRFPVQTNFFFVGLILGSLFIIFEFVRENEKIFSAKAAFKILWFLIGLGIMLALYFFNGTRFSSTTAIETISIGTFIFLFFAGFVGAAAMIIPGISGSFLLLILGVYYTVIKAITDFYVPVLIPVGLGVLAGLILSARLIAFLLEKFPKITYSFILGLVLGSILHMIPQVCQSLFMRFVSAFCMCAGYALITVFEKITTKEDRK